MRKKPRLASPFASHLVPYDPSPGPVAPDEETEGIPFTPVPSRTNRRDGWTEARQRAFIAAIARGGSVQAAARQAGRSARSAYALRDREGAESFAGAWDLAVEMGIDAVRDTVIDRAMHGGWVPVVRRGRIVRMEYRTFDRLAIAILSGRGRDIEENREERARIRAYRRALKAEDRERAAAQKRYDADLERLVKKGEAMKKAARPRVIAL